MDKNNITKKQLEIINLLYRFRFLNRSQIQKLLNQKDFGDKKEKVRTVKKN